ncbi:hypothetical protein H2200_010861 [Cladophialophora chaetospira]|uniref:Uncharacterized protein n=1 Tax=Cladophialophora chaetospira TaxID=386627 RepID=A0AA39CE11_9EURO|nr:hypothetical protein H2200_010861 [Cladophialophora chaetospira]
MVCHLQVLNTSSAKYPEDEGIKAKLQQVQNTFKAMQKSSLGDVLVSADFGGSEAPLELVESLVRRSGDDTNLVESYEPDKYKYRMCADSNFSERFDLLVEGMTKSKSLRHSEQASNIVDFIGAGQGLAKSKLLCKHLNDAPFMYKVLDDPLTNVERIESNRKLNGQKAEVMKRGEEVVAAEKDDGKNKKAKTQHTVRARKEVVAAEFERKKNEELAAKAQPMFDPHYPYLDPTQPVNSLPWRESQPKQIATNWWTARSIE